MKICFTKIVNEALATQSLSNGEDRAKHGNPLLGRLVTNTGVYNTPKLGSTAVGLAPHQFGSTSSYSQQASFSTESGEGNENITDSKKLTQKFKTLKTSSVKANNSSTKSHGTKFSNNSKRSATKLKKGKGRK
jgi:hypothetical protein